MTTAPPPAELLALAMEIAREAGVLLARRAGEARTRVATKSTSTDMVTEVDHESEALIVARLLAARPDDGLLGEEGSERTGASGARWVFDPLDGTTNFLYGIPAFAVAIAAEVEGEVVAGVVHDAVHGETYSASLGGGAFVGARRLAVSRESNLAHALVGTGFGYDAARRAAQARVLAHVLPRVRDIRRSGSAALDLCAVACGRLDAYYESGLQPWDHAAGALIVREAGGLTGWGNEMPGLPAPIVAAPSALYAPLLALIAASA